MNLAVLLLAGCSAGVYVAAIVLVLTRRWSVRTGSLWRVAPAGLAFALERAFAGNEVLAFIATLALLAALIEILRNGGDALASVLALVPIAVMLITIVDRFFPPDAQAELSALSIAILCAPAPVALSGAFVRYLMTTRKVSVP